MSEQPAEVQTPAAEAPKPEHAQHRRARPEAQAEAQAEVSQPVASNAEPTTQHDDYAIEARDAAVEEIAGRYEANDDTEAADRVRARFMDSPADEGATVVHDSGPGETTPGGPAAPTV